MIDLFSRPKLQLERKQ